MSSRSGLPRMWFSGPGGEHERPAEPACRLDRGGDALDRVRQLVQMARRVLVLDRAADGAGLEPPRHRDGGALRGRRRSRSRGRRRSGGRSRATSASTCATTSSSVTFPSRRPSVKAKPELVVASALNPSASSTRAEPASQGFGITNGSPAWSSSKRTARSACVITASTLPDTRARDGGSAFRAYAQNRA